MGKSSFLIENSGVHETEISEYLHRHEGMVIELDTRKLVNY